MCKQKYVIFLLLFFAIPLLHGQRRERIIPRFNPVPAHEEPRTLMAQNEAEAPPTEEAPAATEVKPEVATEAPATAVDRPEEPTEAEAVEEEIEAEAEEETPEDEDAEEPEEPAEPEKPDEPTKDIYLNFENADLKALVDYIGDLKKINVITDPKIAGNKISLTIREPLSVEGAWNIFLTVLEMSGFSIVKVGDVHKIMSQKQKSTEPLPAFFHVNTPAEKLPDSDLTIRYVTFLTNIPISQAQPLLQSMLSTDGKVIPHANANGFVITDKSYNIKSAMKIIQELDRSDVKQSVYVMRLKQANADDVKKLFDGLMSKPAQSPLARLLGRGAATSIEYFPPTTKIITEPRTNSLILLGEQKSIEKIADFIVKNVDTALKGVKSPIHIYELQHTDVDQIKDILEEIIVPREGSPAAQHGGIRGGVKYFKKMKFAMDKQNNRLLVSSIDKQDWKLLKKTIKSLDKPQPQVALETLIVSVDFNKDRQLQTQVRNKRPGRGLGRNIDFQAANLSNIIPETDSEGNSISLAGNLMEAAAGGLGTTLLTFGNVAVSVWNVIRMLKSEVNLTVHSQPYIVTTNMKKASITVGTKRRVVYQNAIAQNTGNAGDARGYKDARADLTIEAKPQINLDGVITLDIHVKISEFTDTEVTSPNTSDRELKTKVSIANGQILVLGGFVKTKVTEEIYKTPVLSSIPVLGWLFKGKTRAIQKEYIFIFMSPTIIKPRTIPGSNLYTKMKIKQAKGDIDDAIEVKKTKDPIHNWFFNPEGETYSHKVVDFANARYQPTSVDIINDPYYRAKTPREEQLEEKIEEREELAEQEEIEEAPEAEPEVEEPATEPEEPTEEPAEEPEAEEPPSAEPPSPRLRGPRAMGDADAEEPELEPESPFAKATGDADAEVEEPIIEPEITVKTSIEKERDLRRQRLRDLLSAQYNQKSPKNRRDRMKQFITSHNNGKPTS